MKLESEPVVVGAVGKVKIPPLRGDFQAEGESPAFGLFHGAAFSTALLPTNCAKEPSLPYEFAKRHTSRSFRFGSKRPTPSAHEGIPEDSQSRWGALGASRRAQSVFI